MKNKKKQYKGVLFDKDGTLIDGRDLWAKLYILALDSTFEKLYGESASKSTNYLHLRDEAIISLGIEEGSVRKGSIIEHSSPKVVFDYFISKVFGTNTFTNEELSSLFSQFKQNMSQISTGKEFEIMLMSPVIKPLLKKLHEKGVKLGIITADVLLSTQKMAKSSGIDSFISYYGTSDMKLMGKPNPDQGLDFITKFGLSSEEVLMVGDTKNDYYFAQNCGFDFFSINDRESWEDLYGKLLLTN